MKLNLARPFFLFTVALFIPLGFLPAARAADADVKEADAGQIAVFELGGYLSESPEPFDFGLEPQEKLTLYGLGKRLEKAKKDDRLKAIVLLMDQPVMGLAQMQELRRRIEDMRAVDKDVYVYLEEPSAGMYLLATAAPRIYLAPSGGLDLTGLHVEMAYFKNLLDKINVQADLLHVGEYKSAGEPFTRTGPSDEANEMYDWLYGDLFDQMVEMIATSRPELTQEEVRNLIDDGPFTANQALEAKLVDDLLYADQIVGKLHTRYGEEVSIVRNYGRKKGPDVDFSSPFAFFKFLGETMAKGGKTEKASIAVVYLEGMIVPGQTQRDIFGDDGGTVGSTTIRRILAKVREDDAIKAVVMRVNSPGGSALASDIIWQATTVLKEQKPFVVSMGNVAASGGYYVSASADTIFADPATITGSIGVIGGKLVTKGLWDWFGITFHEVQRGKNADLYSSTEPFNDAQRELVRQNMEQVYDQFTDRVKQGRADRLHEDLQEIAGGRVYTGRQAHERGLVDRLGGLDEAIEFAAAEANVANYDVRQFPEQKNFFEHLFKPEEDEESGETVSLRSGFTGGWLRGLPSLQPLLATMQKIDPIRARSIERGLLALEMLSNENVLAYWPGGVVPVK